MLPISHQLNNEVTASRQKADKSWAWSNGSALKNCSALLSYSWTELLQPMGSTFIGSPVSTIVFYWRLSRQLCPYLLHSALGRKHIINPISDFSFIMEWFITSLRKLTVGIVLKHLLKLFIWGREADYYMFYSTMSRDTIIPLVNHVWRIKTYNPNFVFYVILHIKSSKLSQTFTFSFLFSSRR